MEESFALTLPSPPGEREKRKTAPSQSRLVEEKILKRRGEEGSVVYVAIATL